MAKKRLEILTDVDRTAINKRIDDISTEYVFGFEETFVATANQVEFTLSKEFDKGMQAVELYINGAKQPSSFFTEVNNKTIKTKKPIAQGDIVNIKAYKSKKTTEVKVIEHQNSHISGDDQLPVATEDTKGLMSPEDKKKIKAVDMKADSALGKIAEHDTEIDNLKQSVSDGKKKVSVAITDKGVETAPDATFDVMATNIGNIITDPSIGTTDAVAGDLLEGKKMVSQGELMTGVMSNNGTLSKIITTQGGKQIITPGYYSGGEVKAQFNNLVPENIKEGVNIGGVVGTNISFTQIYDYERDERDFLHLGDNYIGANKTSYSQKVFVATTNGYTSGYSIVYEDNNYYSFIGSSALFTKDYMISLGYYNYGNSSSIYIYSKDEILTSENNTVKPAQTLNVNVIEGIPNDFQFKAYLASQSSVIHHTQNKNIVYLILHEYEGKNAYVVEFDLDNEKYKAVHSWVNITDDMRANIYNHKLYYRDNIKDYSNTKILDLKTKKLTTSSDPRDFFIADLITSGHNTMYEKGGMYKRFKIYQIN